MGGSSSARARGIHEEEPQEDSASGLTILTPEKREEEKNYEEGLGEQREKSQGIEGEASCGALRIQEDDGAAGEHETEGHAGQNGKVGPLGIRGGVGPVGEIGAQGDHGPAGPSGPSGRTGEAGNPGDPGPKGPSGPKRARVHVKWTCYWKDVWRIVLYSLWIHGTLGCDEGKEIGCPQFSNFGRTPIPYGGSVEMGRIPDMVPQQNSLKIDIYQPSEKFNCLTTVIASHHNCSVRLWDRPVTDCPGFSLEHVGNESVIKYANVTEDLAYCAYVERPNYRYVYQGDVFIDDIPSAPTCRALTTSTWVKQSGCDQDPPIGSVCQFSCPEGYIGHGDVNKTCQSNGTWSSTNFTCEVVTCPVTGPLQTGCIPDSSGQTKVGSICTFPCPSDNQEGDVRKVCQPNGTWTTISSTCQAPTCQALTTSTWVKQSGCDQDPPIGSVCQFSCPEGYIGHGDVNKTCQSNGTWSSTNFTCEVVTCPVTGPLQTGCIPDSSGQTTVGSICTFPCPSGNQEGAVHKVCQPNGTWTTISSTCQAGSYFDHRNAFHIAVALIVCFGLLFVIIIGILCFCLKREKDKNRKGQGAAEGTELQTREGYQGLSAESASPSEHFRTTARRTMDQHNVEAGR